MSYFGIITKITEIEHHPNADRLLIAKVFGNPVIVGLDTKIGDIVCYFSSDGQLSEEFCRENNLFRHAQYNKDKSKTGYFEDSRRVRIVKFRGSVSDGFVCPLSYFDYTKADISLLRIGSQFNELNNKHICNKYVSIQTIKSQKGSIKTSKKSLYPMFLEHFETEQLRYFVDHIPVGSNIIISEKIHGTSARISNTLKLRNNNIIDKIFSLFGYKKQEWVIVNGTRRTVLGDDLVDGFYKEGFRNVVNNALKDNLYKGETVYCEIVGWAAKDKPIMGIHNVEKLKDKSMLQYGNKMIYAYGNPNGQCDFYVYRITMTNEDEHSIEYSWDQVKERCNKLGVKYVPEIDDFVYTGKVPQFSGLLELAQLCTDGCSMLDTSHIREGVCIRVENEYGTKIYKHKSIAFKIMEDIMKESDVVDIEEAS